MKFKQHIPARGAALLSLGALGLAALPASAQSSRSMAPNIDQGAIASAKGDMVTPEDRILKKVRWDQKYGSKLPLGATFKNEKGETVPLGKYFQSGKPVMMMLVFFNCTMLCSEVMNGSLYLLQDREKHLGFVPGKDFEVITISINPKEGPELAAGKKKTYVSQLPNKAEANKGWHLLTGEDSQIKAVADAIGYRYTYNAVMDDYAHPGGIVTFTPDGKVSRYFSGVAFDGREVRMGLIEASNNKIGTTLERLAMLTCFHYNPTTGKYSLAIMGVVRLAFIAMVLGLGTGIWAMRRVEKKVKKRGAPAGSGPAPAGA